MSKSPSRRPKPSNSSSQAEKKSKKARPGRWLLAGMLIYLLLAVWQTWPVVLSPFSQVSVGSEPAASVPLYSTWAIWWNSDRLAGGLQGYWDAPIFFPTAGAFALSEPQPTSMVVAPVVWLTGSRVLAYNVYVWISLVLNGVFAQRLLRVIGAGNWLALWGGMAMVLLPVVIWQLGINQLIPIWGILWTWAAIEQLARNPNRWRGIELGFAIGFGFVTCMHHGLFHAILLLGAAPTLWREVILVKNWPYWIIALLVGLIITGPFAFKVRQVVNQHRTERDPEIIAALSAQPSDYLQAYGGQLIETSPSEGSWRMLSPGWIKVLLAVVGAVLSVRQAQSRRWASLLLTIAILAFLLSLGPNLNVFGWRPWTTLSTYVPLFADVRSVWRFAFFVHMVVVVFAATGLYLLLKTLNNRLNERWKKTVVRVAIAMIALVALLEVRVRPGVYATVPNVDEHQVWIDYVRNNTPANHGIACFPFAASHRVEDYQTTTEWMYLGTFHRVPMVNGYSTHFPKQYSMLRHELMNGFPTEEKLQMLVDHRIRYMVLRRPQVEGYSATKLETTLGKYWLKHVCADEHVDVFEVGGP